MKIIIWGYPLHSHTHSYTHEAFYKAFKHLGYETYWFHDNDYPSDFDWRNCLFWTEGFADKNIPLNTSSIYFVHVCPDPAKYINANVKKFVDVRYNHVWHNDHVYSYTLEKKEAEKVGTACYLQKKENKIVTVKNNYHNYQIQDYDKLYVTWATNKLPEEFDFNDIYHIRENKVYFCGTLSHTGRCENYTNFAPFINECRKNNVEFLHNDPWANPVSNEEVIERTKKSLIAIDIRGNEHIKNGYVPCRVFKSISAGHLGTTNSAEVYNELEGNVLFQPDTSKLFYEALEKSKDLNFIRKSMIYVKENHTYINRVKSVLSLI